jgi:hypothetical protein
MNMAISICNQQLGYEYTPEERMIDELVHNQADASRSWEQLSRM